LELQSQNLILGEESKQTIVIGKSAESMSFYSIWKIGIGHCSSAFSYFVLVSLFFAFGSVSFAQETDAIDLFNKGQDAHQKGDLKSAIEFYETALKAVPEFPEAQLQRGNALLGLGRFGDAESAFRKAVELRDDWSLAHASLGNALVRLNKYDEAKAVLKKAIELDTDNTPAWVAIADLAIRTKANETELRTIYKRIEYFATSAQPTTAILATKASMEHLLKDDKKASMSADRVLAIDPKNLPMLLLIADNALTSNDFQKANEIIRRIEMIDPNSDDIPLLKVRALVVAGKSSEAINLINATKYPSKELLNIKQQLAVSTETDIPALEKQLESEPRNIVALQKLCSLLRKGEPLRAIEFCRRAADVEPNNIDHAIGFGAALLQAKQYGQATVMFQKLLNLAPDNYTIRANFATALFQQKRYTEAKVHFNWLSEKQPTNAAVYFFLAVSHDELGEYPDAMANYQLFLKYADPKVNQLEIDKVNLRLPPLQRQLDSRKGNNKTKSKVKT